METTDKKSAQQLMDILWQKGLNHIIISPGSRNAPLILGFTSHPKYTCLSVPDERSAGFIALGIADETKAPVALVCSSGSALLNYYPAIAEAFYRKIPLVVLSADRPEYLIDQGDGQTIRQKNVFSNHILFSSQLEEFPDSEEDKIKNEQIINTALNIATSSHNSSGGPIHINIPFEEPLYNKTNFTLGNSSIIHTDSKDLTITNTQIEEFSQLWNTSGRVLILVGQLDSSHKLIKVLSKLSSRALILSETTSNLDIIHSVRSIDRLITPFNESDKESFHPDLLISLGGNVVSKRIKALLRSYAPKNHIHIEISDKAPNTYQCLTHHCNILEHYFFEQLLPHIDNEPSNWVKKWIEIDAERNNHQIDFLDTTLFSDIQVMKSVRNLIPEDSILHLANSTAVRYAQLFNWNKKLVFKSNRGTSGIDGIVSTAMGNAIATDKQVFLVVGDISFFYDTNAWWHNQIPKNLKVIIVNNNGGGIFRFIDGPNNSGQLEKYFETHQKNSVKHIALGFGVNYFCASNEEELKTQFQVLSNSNESGILEVFTPQTENAGILKDYFNTLKRQ